MVVLLVEWVIHKLVQERNKIYLLLNSKYIQDITISSSQLTSSFESLIKKINAPFQFIFLYIYIYIGLEIIRIKWKNICINIVIEKYICW